MIFTLETAANAGSDLDYIFELPPEFPCLSVRNKKRHLILHVPMCAEKDRRNSAKNYASLMP